MSKVEDGFEEMRARLRQRERMVERTGEPIYYLVFAPKEIQAVKRKLPLWKSRLENQDGWHVEVLSLATRIQDFLRNHKRRKDWLEYERAHPGDYEAVRATLVSQLADSGQVTRWVEEALSAVAATPKGMLIVTDIEAIHPFLRIGAVEQSLQGRCMAPLVILYPGTRTGQTVLKFLGEYPEDGNYRSLMFGG